MFSRCAECDLLFSSVVRCIVVVCVPAIGKGEGPACESYFDPLTISDGRRQGCVMLARDVGFCMGE